MRQGILGIVQVGGLIALAVVAVYFLKPSGSQTPSEHTDSAILKSSPKPNKTAKIYHRVVTNDTARTYPGLTLAPITGTAEVLLIGMDGTLHHRWEFDATRARLLEDCNMLVLHGTPWGKRNKPWSELRHEVREFDWDSNVVWEHRSKTKAHHDAIRLDNGNTLFLRHHYLPPSPENDILVAKLGKTPMRSDVLVEVTPENKVVWEWFAHKHIDLKSCGWRGCESFTEKMQFKRSHMDWTHTNAATVLPPNKWYDAGDQRFKPGNILIMPRNFWTVMLVDRDSGEVVWTYEGDHNNDLSQGLIRGHEVYMIPKDYPGAGNILVFDNGTQGLRPYSIAREIEPPTKKMVWHYKDEDRFFSPAAGSVQRLKNGNTLISQDRPGRASDAAVGRVFELSPDKEIVWELELDYATSRAKRVDFDTCPQLESFRP